MINNIDRNYPGEFIDRIINSENYPIPHKVGEYTSNLEKYISIPKTVSQWVHFKDRADLVIEGKYEAIRPVHFDGTFTLACNLRCPHCTARTARTKWIAENTWKIKTQISKKNTMPYENNLNVIDQLASFKMDDHIGISWNGGEPSIIPKIYESIEYATQNGIKSCFLTNGVELDAVKIVRASPIIVRVSMNCGNAEDYSMFHGCKKRTGNFEKVLRNIEEIAAAKTKSNPNILFGISMIVDERNINSLTQAIELLICMQKKYPNAIDNILVRPVMEFAHLKKQFRIMHNGTKKSIHKQLNSMENYYDKCKNKNIILLARDDWYESPPVIDEYHGFECLSYGWFGQIMYNGDVQLCSESYCDPTYTIGNLFKNNILEIWQSNTRKELVERINKEKCFLNKCQHNSRGHQLNRIFNQIEKMRKQDKMDIVVKWIRDLRRLTIPPYHSFFM